MKLSKAKAITLFGVLTVTGLLVAVLPSAYAIRELTVGGLLYGDIKLGNDLVPDVLPPPAYVIEAYLEATLALREPAKLATAEIARNVSESAAAAREVSSKIAHVSPDAVSACAIDVRGAIA